MFGNRNLPAFATSLVIHALVLVALAILQRQLLSETHDVLLETLFNDQREQEHFTKDLDESTEISETQNFMAGAVVATEVGATGNIQAAQQNIETSDSLQEPEVNVNISTISIPGEDTIGEDLGVGEINGEVGAVVEGYGAALSRITQELIRLMRQEQLLVVWLFDESESMKDDQAEIAAEFHKVYEELGIQQKKSTDLKQRGKDDILLTSVLGFGEGVHVLTPKPIADVKQIQAAIGRIGIDRTGKENMCLWVGKTVEQFGPMARRQKRQLIVIVVTDESPSDHLQDNVFEQTIQLVQKHKAPVYILGREAIFGYPYARLTWTDPEFGLRHWIRIDRGPETAFPECLQWDGMHHRWDSFSSGFGPYTQVRLAKLSGGIFFMLPGEEENLSGAGAHENRKFAALAMKEYEPLLQSRRVYAEQVLKSQFRTTLRKIVVTLNPAKYPQFPTADSQLNIRQHHYPMNVTEFQKLAGTEGMKAFRAMGLLSQAIVLMEKANPQRDGEQFQRFRAHYDLIRAQCYAYRVRLFQFLLVLDKQAVDYPPPKSPKSNEWNFGRSRQMRTPDAVQYKRVQQAFKVSQKREAFLEELKRQQDRATELYEFVLAEHPGTPWARRARFELDHGYGMTIGDHFRDPRYNQVGRKIRIPNF